VYSTTRENKNMDQSYMGSGPLFYMASLWPTSCCLAYASCSCGTTPRRWAVCRCRVALVRYVGNDVSAWASHSLTHRRWHPHTFLSFNTLGLASTHLPVFRHIGVGTLTPMCLSMRRCWVLVVLSFLFQKR